MLLRIRVYYEDTDCAGVVYYANYLRYFERGRVELLRERKASLTELEDKGILFLVTCAEIEYLSPCKYDDLLLLAIQPKSSITVASISLMSSSVLRLRFFSISSLK